MITFLVAIAYAAEPDLVAKGKPLTAVTALAAPDPGHPGTFGIVATTTPITCAELVERRARFESALVLTVVAASGAVIEGEYAGKSWVLMGGTGTAGATPAAGKTGTVAFDFAHGDSHAKGTLTYTLCADVPAAPPLTITSDRGRVSIEDVQSPTLVELDRPSGWPVETDDLQRTIWQAPDGYTSLSLYMTCAADCAPPSQATAKALADEAAKLFESNPSLTTKVLGNASPTPGAHVLRYEVAQDRRGSTLTVQVWRWAEGSSHFVVCEGTTVPWRAAVLDSLQKACMGLTFAPKGE